MAYLLAGRPGWALAMMPARGGRVRLLPLRAGPARCPATRQGKAIPARRPEAGSGHGAYRLAGWRIYLHRGHVSHGDGDYPPPVQLTDLGGGRGKQTTS